MGSPTGATDLPLLLTESSYFPVSRYLSEEEVLDTENPFVQLLEWGY